MVELRQLNHILLLVKHKSFSKAAVAAHISQPSLSISIKKAEEILGVKLFVRTSKQVVLTEEGKQIAEMAKMMLQTYSKGTAAISQPGEKNRGVVRMGADPFLSRTLMEDFIPLMNRRHPYIRFQISINPWDELIELLKQKVLDFIIVVYSDFTDFPDKYFNKLEMFVPKTGYFTRAGHPLAGKKIDSRQIGEFPWIGNVVSPHWARWALIATDVTEEQMREKFITKVNDYDKTIGLVKENDAIGGHVYQELIPYEEAGKIKILDIDWYIPHPKNIGIILSLNNMEFSPACKLILDEIQVYSKRWEHDSP